jgi:hypothetical protein
MAAERNHYKKCWTVAEEIKFIRKIGTQHSSLDCTGIDRSDLLRGYLKALARTTQWNEAELYDLSTAVEEELNKSKAKPELAVDGLGPVVAEKKAEGGKRGYQLLGLSL